MAEDNVVTQVAVAYVRAADAGVMKYKQHADWWLRGQVDEVLVEAGRVLADFYMVDGLGIVLRDDDNLVFRLTTLNGVILDRLVARVQTPTWGVHTSRKCVETDLVDHGILRSLDDDLIVEFSDAAEFRGALCSLLRLGSTARDLLRVLAEYERRRVETRKEVSRG